MDIIIYSVPLFILALLGEFFWSRRRQIELYRSNDTISNISAGIFQQVTGALPLFLGFASYQWIFSQAALFPHLFAPVTLINAVLLFLLEDLKYYFFHRASHRVALFWSGHVVHHQSEEYNFSVALRQSTLQDYFVIIWAWPFALLGFDPMLYLSIHLLNIVLQFWIHTQAIKRLPRFWEAWLNTPSHHRVHHARNVQYIDKNYAGVLIIWDKMFGSFEPEAEPAVYGVTTATKSWNPFRAQFENAYLLLRGAVAQKTFRDRFLYVWRPPGWTPENPSGKPGYEARPKFNPKLSERQEKACLAGFFGVLLLSAAFLLAAPRVGILHQAVGAAIIISCLVALGLAMNGRDAS